MTDSNANGKVTRGLTIALLALVLALMSATAYNTLANAETNQRVARLESQNEYIVRSLDRIETNLKEAMKERARQEKGDRP